MRRSLRRLAFVASISCAFVIAHGLVACVGDDFVAGSGTGDGDAAQPPGDGAASGDGSGGEGGVSTDLSVDPKTFDIARGGKVTLKLQGAPGATVAVTTHADALADGGGPLAASPLSAPPSVTLDAVGSASVDLVAATDAAQQRVKVTLVANGILQAIAGRVVGKSGDVDQFFGDGLGYVDFDVEPFVTIPSSVVVQPDGKIVVAGDTNDHMFVARFDATGVLDPAFGTGGHVVQGSAQYPTMALLADGSIVVDAVTGAPNPPRVWVLSSAGVFSDAWGGTAGYAQPLSFDQSGVIVSGGAIFVGGTEGGTREKSVVRKYFPDAGVDPTWGTDGTQVTPETNMTVANIVAFTVDGTGKLWATGGAQTTSTTPVAYALDLRFTATGGADIDAPLQPGTGLAIAAQGTKVIISASDAASAKSFLFRNAGQGVPLDPTFGDPTTHYADLGTGIATSIAVDAAGRILAVSGGAHTTFDIVRFDPDGHADTAFGTAGVASIKGFAIALCVSGSFVYAVGKDDAASAQKARLARFWN